MKLHRRLPAGILGRAPGRLLRWAPVTMSRRAPATLLRRSAQGFVRRAPMAVPRGAAGLAVPAAAALYIAVEAARIKRVPRLPEVARDLDELVDAHRGGAPVELVLVGDSVSSGVGCTSANCSFPAVLARLVAAETDRAVHVRSLGWMGARAEQLRAAQLPVVESMGHVDVIVCSVGANDATHLTPPDRVAADLRTFCERAHAATGATVVLTGVPEFRSARALGAPVRTAAWLAGQLIHERQRDLGAEIDGAAFVDVLDAVGAAFRGEADLVAYDGYHPSDAGVVRIAETVAPAVVAALAVTAAEDGEDDDRGGPGVESA